MADESKLAVIEEVVKRMEQSNTSSLAEIKDGVTKLREDFQSHLVTAAVHEERLGRVEKVTQAHDTLLLGERGLVKRMEQQEMFTQEVKKVIWEIARPGLSMLGAVLLIGLGIFGVLLYGLTFIIQKLP